MFHHPDASSETKAENVLIFDMPHCTNIDGSAIQALTEIAEDHASKHNAVIIWEPLQVQGRDVIQYKLTLSGVLDAAGGNVSLACSLEEVLTILGSTGIPF